VDVIVGQGVEVGDGTKVGVFVGGDSDGEDVGVTAGILPDIGDATAWALALLLNEIVGPQPVTRPINPSAVRVAFACRPFCNVVRFGFLPLVVVIFCLGIITNLGRDVSSEAL
jgi:hypothetical protein